MSLDLLMSVDVWSLKMFLKINTTWGIAPFLYVHFVLSMIRCFELLLKWNTISYIIHYYILVYLLTFATDKTEILHKHWPKHDF